MPERTLAIGDIHGCFIQLDALLQKLAPTLDDHLIFLGDYVDRGPDSRRVLDCVRRLCRSHRVTALLGNHEEMMLAARDSHDKFSDWLLNGGDATLRSYGGARGALRDVPADHWAFLQSGLVEYLETTTHIFVHASAYPDLPMAEQPGYMLRWERFEQIQPHGSGKLIVCGHTPQLSGSPANKGYAICLDTNACRGGLLTCLDANSGRVWQASESGRVISSHISDYD
jgi:serine/threonine protein phosphatase 1